MSRHNLPARASGGGGTLPVTDTDVGLYRGGADLLKTDDHLHVAGNTRTVGGIQNSTYQFERSFIVTFPTGADQRASLYLAAPSTLVNGVFDVTIASSWSTNNAGGTIRAMYFIAGTAAGAVQDNHMTVLVAHGPIVTNYALMPISWDATALRWRIPIAKLVTGTGGVVSISVRYLANNALRCDAVRDNLSISAVYTEAGAVTANARTPVTALANADVMTWGTDTTLYRGGADLLQTDDAFSVVRATNAGAVMSRVSGDASSRFLMYAGGEMYWGTGAGAHDTNLYRSAADTLKTDDSLHVGATLRHLGTSVGFYGATPTTKPTVTGSRGDGTALASLLTALATLGVITDSSTA